MKKFYSIVLMAFAVLFSANVKAVNVSNLTELQNALANGGEITLTANIDAGATRLNIVKPTIINGEGFRVKGTETYVFQVSATTGEVVMNDLYIHAAKTNKQGRGILIDDNTNGANLTLNNVTINCTYRAMDVWYSDNVTLTINNSLFQNVQGQTVDEKGNPTDAHYDIELQGEKAGDTRGLNFGQLTNSNITINNTTMQGFFYVLNNITGDNGDMTGTTLVANNSTFKGRAALNVWGFGATYEFNDCTVVGINNYGSSAEGFACFVFNNQNTCYDNSLTINGGTVVSAVFDAVGASNPNANQYMVDTRAKAANITIVINNAEYSCPKNLGNDKGGVIATSSSSANITINGGIYNCPNIIGGAYSNAGGNTGSVTINGGTFDVNVVSPDMTDGDLYKTVTINAGNYTIAEGDLEDTDPNDESNGLLGDDMAIVTNVDGSKAVMDSEDAAKVETVNEDVEITEDKVEKSLVGVASNKTITVKSGKTLEIGEGGLVLADDKAKLVVEDGGTVILHGNVNGNGTEGSIVINASEKTNTQFLIDPNVNVYGDEHPMATFSFTTKSYYDGTKTVFQRFGMPTFDGTVNMTWTNGVQTMIYEYTNENGWGSPIYNDVTGSFTKTNAVPFNMYTMATNLPEGNNTVYSFSGRMMGNQNAPLTFVRKWNYFANSYTAAIDIKEFLTDLKAKYGSNMAATAYIYRPSDNMWDEVTLGAFELAEKTNGAIPVPQTKISPMQAFILYMYYGNNADGEIDYETNVYNPGVGIANPAPARVASNNIDAAMQMTIATENYTDRMTLIEGASFNDGFDNGYDAHKYMENTPFNLYANNYEGQFGTVATDNLEGTILGFSALQDGTYTITFNGNAAYALKDMAANRVVNMENGTAYTFTAQAGQDDARFMVISRADAPTANEEVMMNAKRAGIYTVAGQYVGETSILNTLPAGIYVVDGVKVVK